MLPSQTHLSKAGNEAAAACYVLAVLQSEAGLQQAALLLRGGVVEHQYAQDADRDSPGICAQRCACHQRRDERRIERMADVLVRALGDDMLGHIVALMP